MPYIRDRQQQAAAHIDSFRVLQTRLVDRTRNGYGKSETSVPHQTRLERGWRISETGGRGIRVLSGREWLAPFFVVSKARRLEFYIRAAMVYNFSCTRGGLAWAGTGSRRRNSRARGNTPRREENRLAYIDRQFPGTRSSRSAARLAGLD